MNVSLKTAILRGLMCRCPRCGIGKLYLKLTTVNKRCGKCGLDFTLHRADDAPPYIVLCLLAPLITLLALFVENTFSPPLYVHLLLWMPATFLLALLLMMPVKGMVIAIQWANGMHGFNRKP